MLTYHIEKQRWETIRAQGYPLGEASLNAAEIAAMSAIPVTATYHFLNAGYCSTCSTRFDSLRAETPVGLQMERRQC